MRTRRSQSSNDPVLSGPKDLVHRPVLLHETIDSLALAKGDLVVDATLGGVGHSALIAEKLGRKGILVGIDADKDAIQRARVALESVLPKVVLIEGNFRDLKSLLAERGIVSIDKALFDLGWSSYQLSAGRGFSFLADEPLSMTYAHDAKLSAETIVNEWGEESLADIIYGFGEERYARQIARGIVLSRARRRIATASELAEVIRSSVPARYAHGRLHPATKTFQALRIAVNDELGALEKGLREAWGLLSSGGRIAVITFHSIEDRIVKRMYREWRDEKLGVLLTKKPIVPTREEVAENPRARSGKLRVIEKL